MLEEQRSLRKLHDGREPISTEMDAAVFEFMCELRDEGKPVTNFMLQDQARIEARRLNLQNFQVSNGWLRRWKRRMSVAIRRGTNESQRVPEDFREHLMGFRRHIIHLREEKEYHLRHIVNMDQTMVRFDMPYNSTNNVRGEKTVRIANTGGRKKGFTVALSACADGHMLPAAVYFKEANGIPPRVMNALQIPCNMRARTSSNGWMRSAEVHYWLRNDLNNIRDDDDEELLVIWIAIQHTGPQRPGVYWTL